MLIKILVIMKVRLIVIIPSVIATNTALQRYASLILHPYNLLKSFLVLKRNKNALAQRKGENARTHKFAFPEGALTVITNSALKVPS